jgi:SAM-dependent methyltransferase
MILKFRDIIKLGYLWLFRARSSNDYKKYQVIKSGILINYLKRYNRNCGRLLEVGVQNGDMTPFFNEISSYIVSIDIDKSHLLLAKKKSPDTEIICCDILHPPFIQNAFDMVILNSVIEHIQDDESTLIEIYKLLKNSGYLYIGFPPWYGIFGGHSKIPFFSLMPTIIRNKLSKYKFVRAYPTFPRLVKNLEIIINNYFIIINRNSFLLPNIFISYPLYEFDFFITFVCRKKNITKLSLNKLMVKYGESCKSNIKELSGFWDKINFRFS